MNGTTVSLRSGANMPLVGFGTWQLQGDDAYRSVRAALDAGYRHIDTATAYENETEVGRAVRNSGVAREDIFITTKIPPNLAGQERETIEASLEKLGTGYVDLWLIHWPPDGAASPDTWQRLLDLRDSGLARDVGVSNYSTAQIDELIEGTGEAPAVNQVPWAPPLFDPSTLAASRERGVVLEGYSPFKKTDLTSPVLTEMSERLGVTPAQIVLRWHVQHEVVAIPKSANPERIVSNFDVFGFVLGDDDMARLDALEA